MRNTYDVGDVEHIQIWFDLDEVVERRGESVFFSLQVPSFVGYPQLCTLNLFEVLCHILNLKLFSSYKTKDKPLN
jgi:hypothetical protein